VSGAAHHGTGLLIPADTAVHRLPPQCKVAATGLLVLAAASAPREALWVYALDGAVVLGLAALARVPAGTLLRRLSVEIPFLLFILALPFVASGPRVGVLGLPVSELGALAALSIACKATIGLLATGVLAATTSLPDIVEGLERLRVPRAFTAVAAFIVRYAEVLVGDFRRMRTAMVCRGADARWLWQARDTAAGAASLLVRSFERSERVYLAMVSRGFTGLLPAAGPAGRPAGGWAWAASLAVPALAWIVTLVAWVWRAGA
jgi:cobalt/nickel transport system permease protein